MKICEYCGQELPDETAECPGCGASAFKSKCEICGEIYDGTGCPKCEITGGAAGRACPNCGHVSFQNFCPVCGTNLHDTVKGSPISEAAGKTKAGSEPGRRRSKKSRSKLKALFVTAGLLFAGVCSLSVIYSALTMFEQEVVVMGPESGDPTVWDDYQDTTDGAWQQDQYGWWYAGPDGTYTVNDFQKIDGEIYYFNESGYMLTGWAETDDGKWVYLQEDGSMARDRWITDEEQKSYYMQGNGIMAENVRLRSDEEGIYYKIGYDGSSRFGGNIESEGSEPQDETEKGR